MNPQNQEEILIFASLLTKLADAHQFVLKESIIQTYYEDLLDLTIEQITTALNKLRLENDFFPKISQIRRYILGTPKTKQQEAEHAWAVLQLCAKKLTPDISLKFEDDALAEAVNNAFSGWPNFYYRMQNIRDSRELEYSGKRFILQYDLVRDLSHDRIDQFDKTLRGNIEFHNQSPSPYIEKQNYVLATISKEGEILLEAKCEKGFKNET